MTHRSCEICGREFWEGDCEPLAGAPAYCTRCADMACELVYELATYSYELYDYMRRRMAEDQDACDVVLLIIEILTEVEERAKGEEEPQ